MYERLNRGSEVAVGYRVTSPLSREEMKKITTELEGAIAAAGKIRLLIDLQAFPYADLKVFWEDLKFDVKHARDLQRLALVGGGELEKWGTRIFGALTFTKCRCFKAEQTEEAWTWLTEN
jgi:hypothetical protein